MSTSAPIKSPLLTTGSRPLPLVVFFEGDDTARKSLAGVQRYRRIAHQALGSEFDQVEHIYIVTREYQVEDHYAVLRKPNVRVLALSDTRFKDPRNDGAVYAFLPAVTPTAILERMVDNAIDHIQLLSNRREITAKLQGATKEIHDLNQIGAALSAEHDTSKLLELILTKSREITNSDAGSDRKSVV